MDTLTSTDAQSLLLASEWAHARSRSSKTVGTKSLQNQSVPIIDMSGLLNAIAYNCNRLRCPCARDQINSERTGNGSRLRLIKSANNSSHRDHAARISACSKRDTHSGEMACHPIPPIWSAAAANPRTTAKDQTRAHSAKVCIIRAVWSWCVTAYHPQVSKEHRS